MAIGDGIRCLACGADTTVLETRSNRGSLRRRRACLDEACGGRLTTVEMVAPKYSKRTPGSGDLVAIPRRDAADLEVVPRALMRALRDLMRAQDLETVAPEEHW